MSDQDPNQMPPWPQGVLAVRVGPGANCSSMGSSIQLMWAAAVLGGVIAVVASSLIGSRKTTAAPKNPEAGEEQSNPDDTSAP